MIAWKSRFPFFLSPPKNQKWENCVAKAENFLHKIYKENTSSYLSHIVRISGDKVQNIFDIYFHLWVFEIQEEMELVAPFPAVLT